MHTTPQQHNATRFDGVRMRHVRHLKVRAARSLFRSAAKISGVVLMCASVIGVYSQIGNTVSYFSDSESSIGNRLQAGVALLSISSADDQQGVAAKLFAARAESDAEATSTGEQSESFIVTISPGDESLPLVYTANGELDASDPSGCDVVELDATFGSYTYSGHILDFSAPTTSTMGDWAFNVSIPDETPGLAPDDLCSGSVVFKAKLSGVSDSLSNTFTDAKRYAFNLRNPHAVLGKDMATSTEATTTVPAVLGVSTSTDPIATSTDATASSTPSTGSSGGAPAPIAPVVPNEASSTTGETGAIATSTDPAPTISNGDDDASATSTAPVGDQQPTGSGAPPSPDAQPNEPPATDTSTPPPAADQTPVPPSDPTAPPASPPPSDPAPAPDAAPASPPPAPSGGDGGGAPAGDAQ